MSRKILAKQDPASCPVAGTSRQDEAWSGPLIVPRQLPSDAASSVDDKKVRRVRSSDSSYLVEMYCAEALQTPLLTPAEELELGRLNRAGNELARERLILSNLRLVVTIAKGFSSLGVELPDLYSLGNQGLMKAVERFDPERGKFSTHAAWWIKQKIRTGVINAPTVRIPAHAHQKARDLIRAEKHLTTTLNREPTMQELSKHVGLTQEQIDRIRRSKASRLTVSLDASPSGEDCEDSGDALSHRLPDPNSTSGSEVMMREERLKVLRALLGDTDSVESLSRSCRPLIESHRSKFSDRELDILRKRFGLGSAGEDRQTLEVIGVQYKVTRERIRQLEGIALKKLRIALEEIDQQHDPDRFEINE